jgi:hypothetical protein
MNPTSVIVKPRQWRGPGPTGAAARSRKEYDNALPPCLPLHRPRKYITDTVRCGNTRQEENGIIAPWCGRARQRSRTEPLGTGPCLQATALKMLFCKFVTTRFDEDCKRDGGTVVCLHPHSGLNLRQEFTSATMPLPLYASAPLTHLQLQWICKSWYLAI